MYHYFNSLKNTKWNPGKNEMLRVVNVAFSATKDNIHLMSCIHSIFKAINLTE